ncbi:MAG: nitroreductase family deazaflavin-dependent oxidoreductase [Acidimicrobiales bacterium]
MPAQQTAMDLVTRSMNVIHSTLQKLTGGRVGTTVFGMKAVQLHTTGRRSGQRRTVWLTSPVHDDGRIVLIASKGGDDRHPDWYHNLTADPDVEITDAGTTKPYRARTATAEEKLELWPQIVASYKGYAGYQKRTGRDIPVVICEPR